MIRGNLALKTTEDEARAATELRPFLVRRFEVRPANDVKGVVIAFPRRDDPALKSAPDMGMCNGCCTVCTGSFTCSTVCTSGCTSSTCGSCTDACTSCTGWCVSCTSGWTGKADLTPK